jgi:hypothetical protein
MKWHNRLLKAGIDTALVILMAVYAPALLVMYVVIWLTSPFRNKIIFEQFCESYKHLPLSRRRRLLVGGNSD